MKFEATIDDEVKELDLDPDLQWVTVNGERHSFAFSQQENGRRLLRIGTKLYKIDNVSYDKHTVEFTLNGEWCRAEVRNEQDLLLDRLGFKTGAGVGEGELYAPMPGKIMKVMVTEGDEIEAGRPVAILEAMKMENELKAPVGGVVTTVAVREGDSLEKNALILEIEARG